MEIKLRTCFIEYLTHACDFLPEKTSDREPCSLKLANSFVLHNVLLSITVVFVFYRMLWEKAESCPICVLIK